MAVCSTLGRTKEGVLLFGKVHEKFFARNLAFSSLKYLWVDAYLCVEYTEIMMICCSINSW